jgi:hypothetical protein
MVCGRHRTGQLADHARRARQIAHTLLDELRQGRCAVAVEHDARRFALEGQHAAHGWVVDRSDRAQPSLEGRPPWRARTERQLEQLDQLIALVREHRDPVRPGAELRERNDASIAGRPCEQRRHRLVDRPHVGSISDRRQA